MIKKNNNYITHFLISILIFFSIILNQYYGYIGILPIDSFLVFNSGFDLMNGYYPFKDYWTIKEPFLDLIQAIFFKMFGVSWFVYVLHASIFNCIITITTFLFLKKFQLNNSISFSYSICVAILTYPTVGTPFSDHHALILCVISFYSLILAVYTQKNFYWYVTPILLGFAFMTKQAPTVYVIILISLISLIYFIKEKNISNFTFAILGTVSFLVVLTTLLYLGEINFNDFFYQYYLYPKSLGETRFEWLYPLEFSRIIWRYKLLYLSIGILIYILIKFSMTKIKIDFSDLITIFGVIFFCLLAIMHQLMTINAIFIYCLIPIFCGFSHIYVKKYFNQKKFLNNFLIILTLSSTVYYYFAYIQNRTFMDLRGVDLKNSIDGNKIHSKLSNIKWITMFYPENPNEEANNIKIAFQNIKQDKNPKMVITDYSFISVFLNEYDHSPTRFWYDFHGYPSSKNEYFGYWKEFVLKKIRDNKIKNIYVLLPLHGETKPLENILSNCFRKEEISNVFYKLILKDC